MLSLRSRLLADAAAHGWNTSKLSFTLVTDGEILSTHHPRVRTAFRRILTERKIEFHEHRRVREIMACAIAFERGPSLGADAVLVATDAAAPTWFAGTGLAHDARGFLAVGPTLQTVNYPDVFAAGDCAALIENPREKAGVFAVRAGPPLAANLRRRASGRAVRAWRPQRQHLALISTGERYAVASRGAFMTEGAWVWTLKDIIDRRWMRMYQRTDRMLARMAKRSPATADASVADMRCGGCAAKIGPGPLSRALGRLSRGPAQGVVIGLDRADDAAVLLPLRASYWCRRSTICGRLLLTRSRSAKSPPTMRSTMSSPWGPSPAMRSQPPSFRPTRRMSWKKLYSSFCRGCAHVSTARASLWSAAIRPKARTRRSASR